MAENRERPLTLKGFEKLQEELKGLKEVRRPEIIQAIAQARSYGDLSENAEYHAAKEQQRSVEKRIQYLESTIGKANVIDPAQFRHKENIVFGARVTVKDLDADQEKTYQIVGSDEADPAQGFISVNSLLARSLIGKKAGDYVQYVLPESSQEKIYEVIGVIYG